MTPTAVREAFRIAQEERPGPVLLELPEDIASEECPRGRNGSIDEESR
nr:thiamine pyrophosphate-binding protein [Rhizobium leguminosarum]